MSYNTGSSFNGQRWYEKTIDRRTREALRRKITEFEQAHENDSDTELLDLLRERSEELGYVPYAVDCLAGRLIVRRFGTWNKAVKLANLPKPKGPGRVRDSRLYREEYKRQQKLHRREKERKLEQRKAADQERQSRRSPRDSVILRPQAEGSKKN